ncbi:MAG TPA: ATP-binding cassette domain-containing protein [Candidatus Lustribacter sp.]|jgi:osmoprotectant transport system ATP-binding protein|nr:ATP-binding cassette domain-containing protein [Candidatus Lustribacter sp.]
MGGNIELRGVGVTYAGGAVAVRDVDLTIAGGEFAVFLGPSGSGKSTLLRTINRLIEPTTGTVFIDGVDVRTLDPVVLRRGIGYVIQAVGLFPHFTIGANVGVVPALLGWDRARIARRVDELLDLVQLDPATYRDRYPRQLSGGEQQRVGVARALAAEPRVLLMDEPFGAVDAIVRASLQDEIRRIHRELRTTIVFVTHDVDEALRLADRVVVIAAGAVAQADTPARLVAAPASDIVRSLVGIDAESRRLADARPLLERDVR